MLCLPQTSSLHSRVMLSRLARGCLTHMAALLQQAATRVAPAAAVDGGAAAVAAEAVIMQQAVVRQVQHLRTWPMWLLRRPPQAMMRPSGRITCSHMSMAWAQIQA